MVYQYPMEILYENRAKEYRAVVTINTPVKLEEMTYEDSLRMSVDVSVGSFGYIDKYADDRADIRFHLNSMISITHSDMVPQKEFDYLNINRSISVGRYYIERIAPLLKLKDSEKHKDYCLVLLSRYFYISSDTEALSIIALPIAQVCLWMTRPVVEKETYRLTGERIDFLSSYLINSNEVLDEYVSSNALFGDGNSKINVAKLLVDRNGTLVNVPTIKEDYDGYIVLDLEKVNQTGNFSVTRSSNTTVVIFNWEHLSARELTNFSRNRVFMVDLSPENFAKQMRKLSSVGEYNWSGPNYYAFYSYRKGRELLTQPGIAINIADAIQNYDNLLKIIDYAINYSSDETDRDFLRHINIYLFTGSLPFNGNTVIVPMSRLDLPKIIKSYYFYEDCEDRRTYKNSVFFLDADFNECLVPLKNNGDDSIKTLKEYLEQELYR